MKKCTICNTEKTYTEFHLQKSTKDGYCNWCKKCKSEKKRAAYILDRDNVLIRVSKYRKENPGKVSAAKKRCYEQKKEEYLQKHKVRYQEKKQSILIKNKQYRDKNKGLVLEKNRLYREANREKLSASQRQYQKDNIEERREYSRGYWKCRIKEDPVCALRFIVRRRMLFAFSNKGYPKESKTKDMLGCEYDHLMSHLESMFTEGMSWDNRGEWHIDHIIPLASAKTQQDLIALCHYANLQPLWAHDNLSKGAKMPHELSAQRKSS